MTEYSVSQAKDNLPRLLDRMLAGEEVTITRRGKAIARLTPTETRLVVKQPPVDVAWLRRIQLQPVEGVAPLESDDLIRQMRDERRF